MLFNKKITLYCDEESGVSGELILETAYDHGLGDKFLVEIEDGRFERFCNCGSHACPNKMPEVQ